MNIITHHSHDIKTKFHAVSSYRNNHYSVAHICSKYHISKASLMRWNKAFTGSMDSLKEKSRRPLSPHPNSHTELELQKISALIKRNPHIGLTELYTKLRLQIAYSRHYCSLYRVLVRLGYYINKSSVKKRYVPKKYHTPELLGEKMQLDVKYIPNDCNANLRDDYHYFQYTIIDEASRERFIYPYKEQTSYSTIDFLYRAICYFGYIPRTIQTDNGFEFSYFRETKRVHPFDLECQCYITIHMRHNSIKVIVKRLFSLFL